MRAGTRAYKRLKLLPPEAFGIRKPYFAETKFHYGGFEQKMSVPEAMMILGIQDLNRLTAADLRSMHRKTMLLNHPDRGGSSYIAMKINEARDVLQATRKFK